MMTSADEDKVRQIAQQVHDINSTADQFAVSQTPYHTHNGADSQQINYRNLFNRVETLHIVIYGADAATSANYGTFFIAPYAAMVKAAYEVHSTAGSDASPVSVQIEKLVGTQMTGQGQNLLASGFNLKGAANTVQTAKLAILPKSTFSLKKNDRLGLTLTGFVTSVSQVVIVVQLEY